VSDRSTRIAFGAVYWLAYWAWGRGFANVLDSIWRMRVLVFGIYHCWAGKRLVREMRDSADKEPCAPALTIL
jgi:hypothetical protein